MNDYSAFKEGSDESIFPVQVNEILEREFDLETEIEDRQGFGGQKFYYPRGEAVIKRLNEAFGSCWSFCVKEYFKDSADESTVLVLGELIINMPGHPLRVIQQFAGKAIALNRNNGVVNIGNDYKSAASLALRKCAMQLGIGLYLQKGLPDEDLQEYNASASGSSSSGGKASHSTAAKAPSSASSDAKPASGGYSGPEPSGGDASEKQVNYVKSLYAKKGITEAVDFEHLTSKQASDYIADWKGLPDGGSGESKPVAVPKPEPKKAEEKTVEKPVATPPAKKVAPEDESANMNRFRTISAELIGQEEDIYDANVDKFMLHIYKTNFSKELDGVSKISEEELATLIASIEDEE